MSFRKIWIGILLAGIFLISTSFWFHSDQHTKHLVIVETSDVHGALFPFDFIKTTGIDQGYIAAAYVLDSLRNVYGENNVVYVDCGDLLQGDPLTQYYNFEDTLTRHPVIEALNDMKCDAFIVGNHDIEQGEKVWQRARKESAFPWIAANVISKSNPDSLYFKPYVILKKNGLKIGIFGLITPAIPNWLPEKIWQGMEFKDMLQTARQYKHLRDSVDILIGAFHSGVRPQKGKPGYPATLPEENASQIIRDSLPIFDAILTGHEHQLIPKKVRNYNPDEIPLVMPGKKAMFLSVVDIEYSDDHGKIQIIRKTAKNIKVHRNKLNMKMLKKYQAIQSAVLKFVNQPVGELAVEFSGEKSRLEDTPLIDFIHIIQKDITGADISIASSFNTRLRIPPGKITRKNVFAIYPYENTLYKVRMKGKYLVDLLKRSARYYFVKDGQLQINREVPGYNFDLLDGIRYELIYKSGKDPVVKIISMDDGTDFNPEKEYFIAVNSYRAQQLKKLYHAKIIWRSEKTMRDYIENYFKKHSPVQIKANNNWKIIVEK